MERGWGQLQMRPGDWPHGADPLIWEMVEGRVVGAAKWGSTGREGDLSVAFRDPEMRTWGRDLLLMSGACGLDAQRHH